MIEENDKDKPIDLTSYKTIKEATQAGLTPTDVQTMRQFVELGDQIGKHARRFFVFGALIVVITIVAAAFIIGGWHIP
ncbi:MAG: hypothetical protein E6R04_10200 [Spirochaetes bacterium]|nr:MAG: hypothetical protein E6R04_10200 [Spirochaetota bacterium]